MTTTNPNVPASAAAAATGSAPNAAVTAQQPAQVPTSTVSSASTTSVGLTATPVTPAVGAPQGAVPVDSTKVNSDAAKDRKESDATLKSLKGVEGREGGSYLEQQAAFAAAFKERTGEDPYRRANRYEMEKIKFDESYGDPTKDPVAKQKAMDLTVVLPGAVEDAQKIKDIGEAEAKKGA